VAQPPAGVKKDGVLSFQVDYSEGAAVGYKWYESQKKTVLFPFGFGLSYTTFAYSGLSVTDGGRLVNFTVKNTGGRAGAEIAEVYARLPERAGEPWKRLVGWQRIALASGESKTVTVAVEDKAVSIWDVESKSWKRPGGDYAWFVGRSSSDLPLAVVTQRP
jgi:beta-glucosidase